MREFINLIEEPQLERIISNWFKKNKHIILNTIEEGLYAETAEVLDLMFDPQLENSNFDEIYINTRDVEEDADCLVDLFFVPKGIKENEFLLSEEDDSKSPGGITISFFLEKSTLRVMYHVYFLSNEKGAIFFNEYEY